MCGANQTHNAHAHARLTGRVPCGRAPRAGQEAHEGAPGGEEKAGGGGEGGQGCPAHPPAPAVRAGPRDVAKGKIVSLSARSLSRSLLGGLAAAGVALRHAARSKQAGEAKKVGEDEYKRGREDGERQGRMLARSNTLPSCCLPPFLFS
eukprot:2707706-Rhodomonas_salina.4